MRLPSTEHGMTTPPRRVSYPHSWLAIATQTRGKAQPDPFFARISFPPVAVLQHSSHSPHNTSSIRRESQLSGLENQKADSWLVQVNITSLEAKELPQFTPKEGLAQRDKETHCSHSMAMEVGHPSFPIQQHC